MTADLFGDRPARPISPCEGRRPDPPELERARALCRALPREKTRPGKGRTVHFICENLKALLRRAA